MTVTLPPEPKGVGYAHSPAGEGLGKSQLRRLEKKLSTLPTLWVKAKKPLLSRARPRTNCDLRLLSLETRAAAARPGMYSMYFVYFMELVVIKGFL